MSEPTSNAERDRDRALLVILIAASGRALQAFQASNNMDDREFVEDLKRIIARSEQELAEIDASR